MKKILFSIKENTLLITYSYNIEKESISLINTNIISDNKLIFSDNYIQQNSPIVGKFLKEIVTDNNITKLVITSFDIIVVLANTLKMIENVNTLFISDEGNFPYEIYEILIKTGNITKISCYSMPTYMIELFDKNKIKVESRAEILFTSNFIEENNLISYSKIYYKTSIKISPPLTEQDLKDFDTFCKINRYLKKIHFNACTVQGIDELSKILINNNMKKIFFIIHDNINRKELYEPLKTRKKELQKKKIYIELQYSEEYVKKNYTKQLLIATLITCAMITLLISGGSLLYVILNNQASEKNVSEIADEIQKKISEDNLNDDYENLAIPLEDKMLPKMKSLLELNADTIGWLTVPGTNIDYPVVQKDNNKYYLNHNYKHQFDWTGWVFLNYKNSNRYLDKNTIIFAHNRYDSGVMFGTLSRVTKKEWYEQAKNISIYYNTLYEEFEWEVFSIYNIPVTDDYLQTSFETDEEYLNFIQMIKERSIFKSDVEITKDDRILTLSTCQDTDKRLVVHAVMRK